MGHGVQRVSEPAESRARAAFMQAFGYQPSRIASAPGRVNIIGEHTDYNDGYVLPTPMPLRCAVAAEISDSARWRIFASDLNEQWEVSTDDALRGTAPDALPPGAWQRYALGVIHQVSAWLGHNGSPTPGMDLAIASDVPVGSGLSSSAAFEVALARAALDGVAAPPTDIARWCQAAENTFAGVPCGIMDQLVASAGEPGAALMIDCRSLAMRRVPLPDPRQARFLIIDSGIAHANAAGTYKARRDACVAAAAELGVPALRDADAYMVEQARSALTPDQYNAARHVVAENDRTLTAAEALRGSDLPRLGHLMNLSHDSLRDLYRVSCPEVDRIVDAARACPGVFGARMTGAGMGGCVLALVATGHLPRAQDHLRGLSTAMWLI